MTLPPILRRLAPLLLTTLLTTLLLQVLHAWEPLRVHPDNPHLVLFRGKPDVLVTCGEHYGSVVNADFDYTPYLDVMERDGMNLTRLFLAGFRHGNRVPANDPLAPTAEGFVQPWKRSTTGGPALDGLGKWDFSEWNPAYFDRLTAFLQACSDRGVVAELTLFSTYYSDEEWRNSPFNPVNNVQGFGPVSLYDCYRLQDPNLIGVMESLIRKIVREVNPFDNLYFEIQNEPFWNQPGIKDADEAQFHNRMLEVIREEEASLPNRHLVAHNFPQQVHALSSDFDIINEHYPGVVPGSPIKGTEILLRDHYSRNRILGAGEADTATEPQARLEAWMFLLGGGGIYNGLAFTQLLYTTDDEAGDSDLGNAVRRSIRNAATYTRALHRVSMRRDLSWIQSGLPQGATLQAMANPGQQYVAYLHHGKTALTNFQTVYNPIDSADHLVALVIDLPEGSYRADWTRPLDLAVLATEEFTHEGGPRTLAAVIYQADVALRIDRTGDGDTTPPPSPASLQADPIADGTIRLSWNPPTTADVALYRIYKSDVAGVAVVPESRIAEVPVLTHDFTDEARLLEMTSYYVVTAVDLSGNESAPADEASATASLQNIPFGGAPAAIPGRIEAEDFDRGGQDVAYHDLTPENEGGQYRETEGVDIGEASDEGDGYAIFSTTAGEWLEYTVNVAAAGVYRLDLRSSNAVAGGEVLVEMNGSNVSGSISLPQADAEGEWQSIVVPEMILTAGEQVMRLVVSQVPESGSAGAINWLEFTSVPKTPPAANAGEDRIVTVDESTGTARIHLDGSASVAGEAPISSYSWSLEGVGIANGINPEISLPLGEHVILLTVTDGYGLTGSDEVTVQVNSAGFVNGSFEDGFNGWTVTGNLSIQSAAPYVTTDGGKLVAFNNGETAPNGTLTQTFATVPGHVYLLSFNMGVLAFNNSEQRLQVEVTGAAPLLSETHVTARIGGAIIRWESKSLQFTADSPSTTLVFRDLSTVTHSLDLTLDNVRVIHQITRTLTVRSSPEPGAAITVNPADKTGQANGTTDFTRTYQDGVAVTLSAPPTLGAASFSRWRDNHVELAHIPDVTVVMNGDHTLTAVYVEGLPMITSQPVDAAVAAGGSATFQVTATSPNPVAYQWRFNGVDVEGAHSESLVIDNVQSINEGDYDVVISSVVGSVTSGKAALVIPGNHPFLNGSFENGFDGWTRTGNLTVHSGSPYAATDGVWQVVFNRGQTVPNGVLSQTFGTIPGVIHQLSFDMGVLAFNDSLQRLQVQVTGNSELVSQTHTIRRQGSAVVRWESKSLLFVADSVATTLTFRDVSAVTDSLDLTLDNLRVVPQITRTLTVRTSPATGAIITVSPPDNTGQGSGGSDLTRLYPNATTVSLTAPATFGGLIFSKWQKNETDLATTAGVSVVMDADHTLTAVYVEPPPLVLRTLTLHTSPAAGAIITVSPADHDSQGSGGTSLTRIYQELTTVSLTAPAHHDGLTFSKWRDENDIDLATTRNISVEMDRDHTLTAVYVEGPPVITSHPQDIGVAEGGTATFSVTAAGPGTLSYQWRFNGSDLPGGDSSSLVIDGVQPEQTGTYDVIVSNDAGPVTSNPALLAIPSAAPLLNGSFESGFDGWTRTGNMSIQSAAPYAATDGIRQVAFNSGQLAPNGVLSQTFGTTPGQTYQLVFDMGVLAYNNSQQRLLVELSGSSVLVSQIHVTSRLNNSIIRWETKTIPFTADSVTTTLTFRDLSMATDSLDLTLDHVRLIPQITRTLTITSTPIAGAAITVSPADNGGQVNGTTDFNLSYPNGTTVSLTAAILISGHRFSKWQENGADLTTDPGISVVMDADHALTAVYEEFTPALPAGLRIMPLGDSITYGNHGTNAGYRGPLHHLLSVAAPDFQFIGTKSGNPGSLPSSPMDQRNHQGFPGYTIQDITNNLDGFDNTRFLALGGSDHNPDGGYWLTGGNGTGRPPLDPNIITLMIGTNDLANPTGIENRLRNLVTKLTTLRPSARLFVAKITPDPNHTTTVNAYNNSIAAVVAEFRAAGKNIHLVDLFTGFPANGFSSDGFHPNDTGFDWMARQWHDAILATYPATDGDGPPVITRQPDAVVAATGEDVSFSVVVSGTPPFTYQWRFQGEPVTGATGDTLFLTNIQPANAGVYDVIISNAAGPVTSNPAVLTIPSTATLVNGSFESGFDGWTAAGNVQPRTVAAPYSATHGTRIAAFNTSNSPPNGTLSQSFATAAGASYTLAFDVGVLAYNSLQQQLQVTCTGTSTVLAGNVVVIGPGNGTTRWTPQSFTFTADSSSTVLMFRDISTHTNAIDLLLDNVRLTSSTTLAATPAATIAATPTELPGLGSPSLEIFPGTVRIRLIAPSAGFYVLEKSDDLVRWIPAGKLTAETPGPVEFEDSLPAASDSQSAARRMFYRIGRLPDAVSE